ncbi:Bacterial regulatory helix-turn-helix proteins, AraC family [Megamonas hypermegale ART12/1]|nr:Bacterial regulatory helix-turn-helix proteins, AraC family [Megamonas hypermegale ART12/1]
MMNVNVGQRKKDLARLNIILKYLQENYKQNIALEDIAKLVHFQTNYFCRFF